MARAPADSKKTASRKTARPIVKAAAKKPRARPPKAVAAASAAPAPSDPATASAATATATAASAHDPAAFDAWATQALTAGVTARAGARSADGASTRATPGTGGTDAGLPVAALASPTAVLEVHFADGSVYYAEPADFVRQHALPPQPTRSGAGGPPQHIALPFQLSSSRIPRSRSAQSASAVERYTVTELTPPTALDQLFNVAETFRQLGGRWASRWLGLGSGRDSVPVAAQLCAAYENSSLEPTLGERGGVLLLWRNGAWTPLDPDAQIKTGARPVLLLLHGTASSTEGSFGKLWKRENAAPLPNDFEKLSQSHTLLGWDHRSLTRSPIDNTIELIDALLKALPDACRMDVVSHSRGGLVGELFALRTAAGLDGVRSAFAEHFGAEKSDDAHPDLPRIDAMFDALSRAAAQFAPGSFVRVACPARGTLLADGRTDLFLSMLLRAVGLATSGVAAIVFDRLTKLVKSLVAARADARTLPGLEAMIPGSPLTLALAHCEARPTDRLRVVAGDAVAQGLSGLFTLVADVFYGWHDHDYVVHTRSMFGGLKRTRAPLSLRWENSAVSHFAYFAPGHRSRNALFTALAGADDGYSPMDDDERQTRGLLQALKPNPLSRRDFKEWVENCNAAEQARKPVLVVLAGIMGSELKRSNAGKDSPMWLSVGAMVSGQLRDLELKSSGGTDLEASGLLALSYERLLERASERYNVLSLPFDWRRPIRESGVRLAQRLQEVMDALTDRSVPIHVVAHSMGGLVARHALYIDDSGRKLWTELKRRNSRLLMLGTPNKGAYAPAQLLSGQHSLAQVLGVLARKVSGESLALYGAAFPGLMQMLPQAEDKHFGYLFDIAAWDKIRAADPDVVKPNEKVLDAARAYVESAAFLNSYEALCEDKQALYVAGVGETPLEMRPADGPFDKLFGRSGGVEFMAGEGGDGTVPWSSALTQERTWYAPCEHGTLADHTDSFAAYFELLESGDTRKLSKEPPRSRATGPGAAGANTLRPLRTTPHASLLPTSDAELADFVGQRAGGAPPMSATPEPIEVRVVHGGLDYARYPLMVGHYLNDTPSGAAKRVDEKLDGQLQHLLDWKLFAGASRTAHYLRPNNHSTREPAYRGAIVLGLGSVGEVTPGSLAETVTRGVLRYAFEHIHRDPYAPRDPAPVDLRLSTLLVGTQIQAVTTRDALAGILLGVWRAAQLLLQMHADRVVRIRELEIIEIDEHTALDAAYELHRLMQRGEWSERLTWPHPVLETREGALSGYRLRNSSGTWQRLVVRQDELGGLNFALIGERARVESTQVYSDVASLQRFIERASDDRTEHGDRFTGATDPALGCVLFQMLLPQELKSRLANLDNTVLVVDDDTARYPWELLTPPSASATDGEIPQPFVVHAGLVRQRVTEEFRRLPAAVCGQNALIVGAPATGGWKDEQGAPMRFNDLPGARAEAHAVEAMLRRDSRDWDITSLISPEPAAPVKGREKPSLSRREAVSFEQVRVALLEKHYRLLHLCGHGVVDQWMRRIGREPEVRDILKTGMVLSDQEVLGAADVEQMSPAPEFVFINCCYSGRDGEVIAVDGPRRTRRDAVLASSLALRFIDMGARAVIAAGWQVDDRAALEFAEGFYQRLLGGMPFGDAVKAARAEIHDRYGDKNNTWGAYQCYGDPTWTLSATGTGKESAGGGTSRLNDAEHCMSAGELAARIMQVAAVAGDKPPANILAQLDRLIATLQANRERAAWLVDSRVRAALGIAYRELGDHRKAAEHLQRGARTAYSEVQIGQLDLLVNSLAREGSPKARVAAEALLGHLTRISEDETARWPVDPDEKQEEPTAASERLCLHGSRSLHQAAQELRALDAGTEGAALENVLTNLDEAVRYFATGYEAKCGESDALDRRSYALSNTLLSAGLAVLLRGAIGTDAGTKTPAQWLEEATRLQSELEQADDHGTFWRHATVLELWVARGLYQPTVAGPQQERAASGGRGRDDIDRVSDLIDAVLMRWPSPIQLDSLTHRFELIKSVSRCCEPTDPTLRALAVRFNELAGQALERLQSRYRRLA